MLHLTTDPKKRFIAFVFLILIGLAAGYLLMRKGFTITPEVFKGYVQSLGSLGPLIYIGLFICRPFFFISSIALFVAGGLAFGPIMGPLYASFGATLGGSLAFWISRQMGHDFVVSKIKLASDILKNTTFNFSAVLLLSILPVMPLTGISYGAGLSYMSFRSFFIAHGMGLIPRAFAFGFFGSSLMEVGSAKFLIAAAVLTLMILLTVYFRFRLKPKA